MSNDPKIIEASRRMCQELDPMEQLASAVQCLADRITPHMASTLPGTDATGGTVASLTEAVMGITSGLVEIAKAIDGLSASIREQNT